MSRSGGVPTWRRALGPYPIVILLLLIFVVTGWRLLGGNAPPPEPEPIVNDAVPANVHRQPPVPEPVPPPMQDVNVPFQGFEIPPPAPPPQAAQVVFAQPVESSPLTRHFGSQSPVSPSQDRGGAAGASGDGRPGATINYKPAQVQGGEVGVVTDLQRTIKPSTRIDCVLDQAIDGTHPGPLVCHLKNGVKGWTPNTWLMAKDTPVIGQYEPLSIGQGRMMAMAANAYTTEGLIVPLGGSPMTDELGRIGMPGQVSNRWMERIGNAILTDAALSAINLPAAALQSRSNGINFNTNSTEGVVNSILQSTINLPPIFHKNQGEEVSILITQPIHFGALRYEAAR